MVRLREPFNAVSHGVGLVGATGSLVLLMALAEGVAEDLAVLVYGLTHVLLFAASSLYHALDVSPAALRLFQRLDLSAIHLFIAGTYTPPVALGIGGPVASVFLVIAWTLALAGVAMNLTLGAPPRNVRVGIYVAMGWLAVTIVLPLVRAFDALGIALLFGGGVIYTVGGVLYAVNRPARWGPQGRWGPHELWHLFVLAGSFTHFVFIAGWTV